jgi:hypothetical protein
MLGYKYLILQLFALIETVCSFTWQIYPLLNTMDYQASAGMQQRPRNARNLSH